MDAHPVAKHENHSLNFILHRICAGVGAWHPRKFYKKELKTAPE